MTTERKDVFQTGGSNPIGEESEPFGNLRVVGVGDLQISTSPLENIITYSLGSCVGLTLFDPEKKIGGMLHAMLPTEQISRERNTNKPGMFVDTGLNFLIKGMTNRGARKDRLLARVAGGSRTFPGDSIFDIGAKNHTLLKRTLGELNIPTLGEDVGGISWRSLCLIMKTGKTYLKTSQGWRVL